MGEHEVKGVLHEVLHVPNLVKDLFLVHKAIVQGLKVKFEQEEYNIKNDAREIL
jgi:predicted metallopeptidase